MNELTPEREAELRTVAHGLMRETLHGKPPLATTMLLAIGAVELLAEVDALRAEVERLKGKRDSWKGSAIGNEDDLSNALAEVERLDAIIESDDG